MLATLGVLRNTKLCLQRFIGVTQFKNNLNSSFCRSRSTDTTSMISLNVRKVKVAQESTTNPGQKIDFELSVIDTHPGDSRRPTVVGLHGFPGLPTDFEPLIQQLVEKDIRFIAPLLPGFDVESKKEDSWKLYHLDCTTAGRADIVKQVLQQTGVDRVSVLMCHSGGSWVGYKLAAELDSVQSLCLLNPVGARAHRSIRPRIVIHLMAWLVRQQSLHFIIMPLYEWIYNLIGFSGVKAGYHLMVTQQIISQIDFQDTLRNAAKIREKQVPLVFAYTLNDKVIEVPVFEEMLFQHLGVSPRSVTAVSAESVLTPFPGIQESHDGEDGWFARGLRFERGGHIVHKRHSNIILDNVMRLITFVEGGRHEQRGRVSSLTT